ncbi:MAG TPA: beta-galactosidase GalB [Opitutaceae bacterium]|nr:beta-galactosidase GalB [Opitutaceae bacterium]
MPTLRRLHLLFLTVALLPAFLLAEAATAVRERTSFNDGWRFHRGDAPEIAPGAYDYFKIRDWLLPTGADLLAVSESKAVRPAGELGGDVSFVKPNFDDASWRTLRLPHDWAIEGPFQQELWGETGKLPYQGAGWYRKHFTVPASDAGKRVQLEIDGAMSYSAVWLNGRFVGGWPYGYSSYQLDLTPYLNFGGENVLAIRLDNVPESSRWYPGAGLYRNVWLTKTGDLRVRQWGVFVTAPRLSAESATVNVDVYLENLGAEKAVLEIVTRVFELGADGRRGAEPVATSSAQSVEIDPTRNREGMRANLLEIAQPKLWDLAHPARYVAEAEVRRDGVAVDRVETPFGLRTIAYDADRGFLLNGRPVKIQGVCLHHDLGALGAAINVRAIERQIEILQAMGCNALRLAHNPPSPEMLELCDRMGMLVMDEAFDAWHRGKKWPGAKKESDADIYYYDYARAFPDWHERDLRALIRRDRNHPSVIMWSIGNEILEQWFADGWKYATRLAGIVREEDRTRPVTGAFNNGDAGYTGFQTALDLVGFNYKPKEYPKFHARNPTIPVLGSETAAMISSRGEYFFPVTDKPEDGRVDFQVSSYDVTTEWFFNAPDVEFRGLDEAPYTLGEFVWTGFDYLGEPTPYNGDRSHLLNVSNPEAKARLEKQLAELGRVLVPSRSSYFGIVDLAGFPKDRYYLYQARWRPELPMAHILPHWNWPERVGQVTPVRVYSSGDEVELFLNGRSLGRKKREPLAYRFCWDDTVYEPGELKAVAYKGGQPWAEAVVRTTGPAAKLTLAPDRAALRADGDDLAFVTLTVADSEGRMVPRAKLPVHFTVEGPAEIIATDNGDATSHESFQSPSKRTFNGLALAIIRTKAGQPGEIVVRATAEGLAPAACTVRSR